MLVVILTFILAMTAAVLIAAVVMYRMHVGLGDKFEIVVAIGVVGLIFAGFLAATGQVEVAATSAGISVVPIAANKWRAYANWAVLLASLGSTVVDVLGYGTPRTQIE